ncbi:hypothetical protein ACIPF8_22890 [Collimonas sp. NPDC087041]|uniref:hypothetical protein n=1 Tax=Collimonas sp. NPDC087041 TaxID=3363960 RepID=UPI0038199DDD
METYVNDNFLNEIIDKILRCATLALYGQDVRFSVLLAIKDVRYYLTKVKTGDPRINQRIFECSLAALANNTHPSIPDYKKTLEYAVSLMAIDLPNSD